MAASSFGNCVSVTPVYTPGDAGRSASSARDFDGPDQEIQDSHLGQRMAASSDLLPDRPHSAPPPVHVAFVAPYQPARALPQRSLASGAVVLPVPPHDPVEH